ncbi:transposase [Aphanizomenon flos-aquae]|uniref:transposase n=1 Tax=Aphanizomenon flos-aquae TaxID=1176 RepID=UPI0030B85A38
MRIKTSLNIKIIPFPQIKYIKKIYLHNKLWKKWEDMGLYIFFLPKYCSEMNPIELEWQHLKKDELSGQIFDDELDLAYAVIDGVTARGKKRKL